MKFQLTFKTSDVLDQIEEDFEGEDEQEKARQFADKYMTYDEYITVDFDTDDQSATVVKK